MSAAAILEKARRRGLSVNRDGAALRVEPRRLLDHNLREALRAHRDAVLEALDAEAEARAEREAIQTEASQLNVAVVLEAHGETFVVVPDTADPVVFAHLGVVLTESEVHRLEADCAGAPLPAVVVRAIAATKRTMGGVVEAHVQRRPSA